MVKILKLEKFFFYSLVFLLFFQGRFILRAFKPEFNEWTSAYLYLTDFLILTIIFLWLWRWFGQKPREKLKIGVIEVALVSFLAFSALSLAVSNNFWLSFYGFVKLVEFGALFFYLKNNLFFLCHSRSESVIPAKAGIQVNESGSRVKPGMTNFDGLNSIFQTFVASASLQSVVAIWQFFGQKSLGIKYLESPLASNLAGVAKVVVNGQNYIRAYGLVPHPNILAAILILAIFGLVYLFLNSDINLKRHSRPAFVIPAKAGIQCGINSSGNPEKKSRFRIKCGMTKYFIFILVLVINSAALFFTFSRAITAVGLALLIIWLSALFWRRKESRRPVIIFFILLAVISSLLLAIYWPYASARYDLQSLGQSQALNLRVYYNNIALDFIKASPIFGIGQGNFVWANSNLGLLESWMYQPAHNIYLLIASENGLLGLLAFLAFLFLTIRSAWKYKFNLEESHLLFVICFLLLVGLFDHFLWDIQQGQIILWIILGILASVGHTERSEVSLARLAEARAKRADARKIGPHSLTDKARPSGG